MFSQQQPNQQNNPGSQGNQHHGQTTRRSHPSINPALSAGPRSRPAARQGWTAASSSLQPRAEAIPMLSRSRSSGIQPIAVVTVRMIVPTARVARTLLTRYSFPGPGNGRRITVAAYASPPLYAPARDRGSKESAPSKREMEPWLICRSLLLVQATILG
jgi:hypothetical protein